jgi:hypothetical protein
MWRPPLLVPAIAIAASLAAVSATVAPAASPEAGTIVTVELTLKANHGLHARLETSDDEMVTLQLRREGRLVIYKVKGEVTATGLKVRLGRLGLIDVAFTPTKTLSSTEPSEGCTGEPRTLREGIFAGTIEFTGERKYVRIQASETEGSMRVISQWQCPEEPTPFKDASLPLALSSEEKEPASLFAVSRRCNCGFFAGIHYPNGRGRSIFYSQKAERREGIEIVRETLAHDGASAFAFDNEEGTATVRPPRPFSGHATFKSRPDGRDLWRSTIRVPFLGSTPLNPHGPDFQVTVLPEYFFHHEQFD